MPYIVVMNTNTSIRYLDILGAILIVGGVVIGIYVGIWWAFVGGIMDVIHAVRAPELAGLAVAWGVLKICFAGLFGWVAAIPFMTAGYALTEL
jgi:hypothetical protein